MDLGKIVLKSLPDISPSCTIASAKIVRTLGYRSYTDLVNCAVGDPRLDRIAVNDRGRWLKYYPRKVTEQDKQEIVEIARADSRQRYFLELYFGNHFGSRTHNCRIETKLEFVQKNGLILVESISGHPDQAGYFTWQRPTRVLKPFSGRWTPTYGPFNP